MNYISQSPIPCSKGILKCALSWTNFPEKDSGYMSETNVVLVLTNKRRGKSSHSQFPTLKIE